MDPSTTTCYAHAKVNLALRVVGRQESDGYHLLEMVNAEIALADELTIERRQGGEPIIIAVQDGAPPRTPVAAIEDPHTSSLGKAFSLFCSAFSVTASISVRLKKRIPIGGGLGGGTSDAATLLRWCELHLLPPALQGTPETEQTLQMIGCAVGADVPFSLIGGSCLVTGIGESVEPLPWSLTGVPIILVIPPISIPTPEVFRAFREGGYSFSPPHLKKLLNSPPPQPSQLVFNDLEPVAAHGWPLVGTALAALRADPSNGLSPFQPVIGMTGSGSTIFCLPPTWSTSQQVENRLFASVTDRAPKGSLLIRSVFR